MFGWIKGQNKKRPSIGPSPLPNERIYAVGDIHGRHDLLYIMIEKIFEDLKSFAEDERRARLVFLGDYIDRGDHSREVLDILVTLAGEAVNLPITCLQGNHEAALLRFLDNPILGKNWLQFGGLQTLASYNIACSQHAPNDDALKAIALELRHALGEHVVFLREMPLVHRSGSVIFAHAGLDPDDPDGQKETAVLWGQSRFLENDGVDGLRVVHGHYDGPEPILTRNRICVDTGAYYTGRLTAVRIDETTTFITADALENLSEVKLRI